MNSYSEKLFKTECYYVHLHTVLLYKILARSDPSNKEKLVLHNKNPDRKCNNFPTVTQSTKAPTTRYIGYETTNHWRKKIREDEKQGTLYLPSSSQIAKKKNINTN